MFKIVYVLVFWSMNTGATAHLQFNTMEECKQAIIDIKEDAKNHGSKINGTCITQKIPIKKTKCKVINATVPGFIYPTSIECVEE